MGKSKIDWCDRVWNPVTGCDPVSTGCIHCYAARMAPRLAGRFGYLENDPFRVTLHPERLDEPLHWRKPARVFVDSMGDLFHKDVPDDFIDNVFATMGMYPQHTFQILTKRADRMADWFRDIGGATRRDWVAYAAARLFNIKSIKLINWPLPNVWPGVSIENQTAADERIPLLLQTPAAVRFVSVEPMLEMVKVLRYMPHTWTLRGHDHPTEITPGLDWVICGCESGPQARPMEIDWAYDLRDQCIAMRVPFFFKQAVINGRLVHMPELDGRQWQEYPEVGR
jgi:protein gp37